MIVVTGNGKKQKKTPKHKPIVGMTSDKAFNVILTVDLKPYNDVHVLHMTKHATQFTV